MKIRVRKLPSGRVTILDKKLADALVKMRRAEYVEIPEAVTKQELPEPVAPTKQAETVKVTKKDEKQESEAVFEVENPTAEDISDLIGSLESETELAEEDEKSVKEDTRELRAEEGTTTRKPRKKTYQTKAVEAED